VGHCPLDGFAQDVAIVRRVVYVVGGESGLWAVDVTDPAHPVPLDVYDTPGSARAIDTVGYTAYLADGGGGLRVIDVGQPSHLVELGFYDMPDEAWDVTLVGQTAYVADWGPDCVSLTFLTRRVPMSWASMIRRITRPVWLCTGDSFSSPMKAAGCALLTFAIRPTPASWDRTGRRVVPSTWLSREGQPTLLMGMAGWLSVTCGKAHKTFGAIAGG
jgi:hypothetical protein